MNNQNHNLKIRIRERIGQIEKDLENRGLVSKSEGLVLRNRAFATLEGLEDFRFFRYLFIRKLPTSSISAGRPPD